ncbi:LPS assembly lipoprotein LptE [Ottowia sp.]|uniref:LPS-assembly lipoprotein LptE n=1 Tax=Ottowia sp. TaxID=1898956 RepID=UPI003A853BFB
MHAHLHAQRRHLIYGLGAAALLAGCGFQLRQAPHLNFQRIALAMPATSLALELRRQLEGIEGIEVVPDTARAQIVLHSAGEQRERTVVGRNASGEVREYQLRIRFAFRLQAADGNEVLPSTEILRQMDQSYSETAALSKETEALMLYKNMQGDIAQQVIRRLSTIQL